jgi:hypothetical protein
MVVEGATTVPWTKPEDISYDHAGPLPHFGGLFKDAFNVAMFDASVLTIDKKIDATALRAAITPSGGEVGTPWKAWIWDKTRDGIPLDELELRFETMDLARTLKLAQHQLEEIRARLAQAQKNPRVPLEPEKGKIAHLQFEKRRLQHALDETRRELAFLQNALNREGGPPRSPPPGK